MSTPAAASSLRTAASLLVIAPSSHILFMLRPATGSFPSTHVFPGGSYDQDSDPSLSYTAFRETYEETGLLLGPQGLTAPVVHAIGEYPSYDSAFKHVFGLNPQASFSSSSSSSSESSSSSWWSPENEKKALGLDRISNWTTPAHIPKRFATQFFVYRVPTTYKFPELPPLSSPPLSSSSSSTTTSSSSSPVTSVNSEVEKLEWLTPLDALTLFKQGKIKLMPPQFYLMTSIFENGLDKAIEKLQSRVFTPTVINKFPDGKVEMDWGEGESGIIKFGKKNVVDEIEIVRSRL